MSHPASASTSPADAAFKDLAARIDAALPQTQCTRCGYPDCASYAQAIAQGEAAINQCPPGGAEGVARLAAITGHAVVPLSADHGVEGVRTVAFIDEAWCIGCTLCIKACPTDAIVGSHKKMHTVIEPYCTGCELCIPVCPVDCIQLDNASGGATGWAAWSMRWHFKPSSATSNTASGCLWKMSRTMDSMRKPIPHQPPCHQPPYRARRPLQWLVRA